jgi:hypothetical protein
MAKAIGEAVKNMILNSGNFKKESVDFRRYAFKYTEKPAA